VLESIQFQIFLAISH